MTESVIQNEIFYIVHVFLDDLKGNRVVGLESSLPLLIVGKAWIPRSWSESIFDHLKLFWTVWMDFGS